MSRSMNPTRSSSFTDRAFLFFGIIAFLYFTSEVFKPLALSVLLSFALRPAAQLLERLRVPRVPAVVLTVGIVLGLLGGIGYVVGQQLTSLATRIPDYQDNIETKLSGLFKPDRLSTGMRISEMVKAVTAKIQSQGASDGPDKAELQKVEIVTNASYFDQIRSSGGPYLEFLGTGSFVLILVLFLMVGRDDHRNRIIELIGQRHVGLATRTMEEISQRISRYLGTFALVNSGFGLVIGVGTGLIGLPYAVLWGCLAGILRFIPYVGPAIAVLLPLVFSFAHFSGWAQPLEVVALFAVVEVALNSFLEPVIYGKTTGVSALGLLVSAMFWTWLWGIPGLLLSTPLTVCLAVLGKYVPSLNFFGVILGEQSELGPDVRFYQRLLSLDREGAKRVIEEVSKTLSRVEIFDQVMIPTLSRMRQDSVSGELDDRSEAFISQVIGEVLDAFEGASDVHLPTLADASDIHESAHQDSPSVGKETVIGLAQDETSDRLMFRMLEQLLSGTNFDLEVIAEPYSPLEFAERVSGLNPKLVIVSHLSPRVGQSTRYLVRRLRARFATMPIFVGRWGTTPHASKIAKRFISAGASRVVFSLADCRDQMLGAAAAPTRNKTMVAKLPS